MLNKMSQIISIFAQPKLFKLLMSMNTKGYLNDIGWIKSFNQKLPVDKNNNPLPWVTYSFIDFISGRLTNSMDIFEYGSGNSTLWYSKKVKSVTSVEHDSEWYEKIKNSMPDNVTIYHENLVYNEAYCHFSSTLNKHFDVIIIDGRDRVNCIKNVLNSLKENGIIVLDDSEREQYNEGIEYLLDKNFKKIDFWGISPGAFFNKCTTIFYKNENCIGL